MRRIHRRILGIARGLGVMGAALIILLLLTFAIPIPEWRTGELPAPPLPVIKGGPPINLPERIWIDSDAGCGYSRTTDPDDCFTLLLLAQTRGVEIVGISTVHGNAPLVVTDRIIRELMAILNRVGVTSPPIYRGSAGPLAEDGSVVSAPAHTAIQRALEEGPLTLVSLGPLTNIAAALNRRPDLQANVARLIAVMGRRQGHLFHPSEAAGGGFLLGHGPVFRDFNFDKDRLGATVVLRIGLPMTLIPYEAARGVSLTATDLTRLEAGGGASAWLASRTREWLDFWKTDIGKDGFYPFDLLAGAYVVEPQLFDCAKVQAWVSNDHKLWRWIYDPEALLVGLEWERPGDFRASSHVVYCPQIDAGLHRWLMTRLGVSDQVVSQ